MDLNRKLELVKLNIQSVSGHVDVDASVRLAALTKIEDIVALERTAIKAEIDAQIGELKAPA